jgi:superoxide dismutase, Fe-Mn family
MSFTLEPLPYAYDALQPHLSKESFEYHHDKHHATYVTNANNLIKGTEFEGKSIEDTIVGAHSKNTPIFNNVAQHYNHSLYWLNLKPNGGGALPGTVEKAIVDSFGSVDKFKEEFQTQGLGQFGSGWVWLEASAGKLAVRKTANAENPLIFGATPLAVADVWEHSYYIDYRNRRADYLKAFLDHLVNWAYVEEKLEAALK